MGQQQISINGRAIGADHAPYIIAELSANHNGDFNRAVDILLAAKKAGVDAVKLQSYTADTITIPSDAPEFRIEGGLWDGKSLYKLYEWAHMPWDWHKPLFDKARALDLTIFSSPFDFSAVDMLEDLNAPAYKIASFEAVDLPLVRYTAGTGKPMIISTGMTSEEEIAEVIAAARDGGCKDLVILHCVSAYPAEPEDYNLRMLQDIAQKHDVLVGLSDHTIDNVTAVTSVALGACLIEKHFTLDRSAGGPDDSFSLEPSELEELVTDSKTAWQALGRVNYERSEKERGNIKFRRSLYIVEDVKKGDVLTSENMRSIRPGYGLAPRHYEALLGRKMVVDAAKGTALSFEMVE
ncbi:MAG: pseudaminic acid synthase [Kordiimonas sp.]|nr:pseudaminic acid synthase [Kordiimonas sp.]